MNRLELIKRAIELHNIFCMESTRLKKWDMTKSLFDLNKLVLKPERYYIVETLSEKKAEGEDKNFEPRVEVRYHLRSQEAKSYGSGHDAFYKRYLSTIRIMFNYCIYFFYKIKPKLLLFYI